MNTADLAKTVEKTADSRIVAFAFRIVMTVGLALLLLMLRSREADERAARVAVADQIKEMNSSIAALNSTVGQIQVTITEGLKQTLGSQGLRIEALERRTDKLTDDQAQLRVLVIQSQAGQRK